MKNDLSCDVVRDLLPSYIENLTSDDSNQAVAEHLSRCGSCRELYKSMCPDDSETAEKAEKELDYLKSIKRKSRRKLRNAILITAGSLLVCFALAIFIFNFIVGSPLYSWSHRPSVSVEGETMHLEFMSPDSGYSYAHFSTEYTGFGDPDGPGRGQINIKGREVLSSPIYPSGTYRMDIDLENIEKVSFMGRTIWENGLIISTDAEQIWGRNVEFVGSAYEVRALLDALHMPDSPFTISLQTDREPYGLEIIFDEGINAEGRLRMVQNTPIILALINNLGRLSFSFPDARGLPEEYSYTEEDAAALLPELYSDYNRDHGTDWQPPADIKDFSSSVYHIQQLISVLGY